GVGMARGLVVEDEESFSDALSYMLRKEGFEVAVAATGTHALTEFDRNGADIVLLDLMLPEMSGTEVCRQLRPKSHVPIIMATARDRGIDKAVGLEIRARAPRRARAGWTGASSWRSARTTTSRSRTRRASWWPVCARCCGATPAMR